MYAAFVSSATRARETMRGREEQTYRTVVHTVRLDAAPDRARLACAIRRRRERHEGVIANLTRLSDDSVVHVTANVRHI